MTEEKLEVANINGIIIVKVPDKCCNCRMCFENEYYDQFECYFKPGTEIRVDEEKQEWCPIKPLPKKSDVTHLSNNSYLAGWNDCKKKVLDYIKKIKDGNRKEKLYAKYPPRTPEQGKLNLYSQGYEDGTDNFYNALKSFLDR